MECKITSQSPGTWHTMNLEYRRWTLPAVPWIIIWWFFGPSCDSEELMWLAMWLTRKHPNIREHYHVSFGNFPYLTSCHLQLVHNIFCCIGSRALCDCLSGFVLSGERGHRGPLLVWQAPGAIFFQNPQAKRRERRISWTHLSKRLEGWKSCLVLLYFYCQSEFSENAFPCFLL